MSEVSRGDDRSRRAPLEQRLDYREIDVGNDDVSARELVAQDVRSTHIHPRSIPASRVTGNLDGDRVEIYGRDRVESESHSRDGHDARAAAGVEHGSAFDAREKLDAYARRRMRTRAERATRIDDDHLLVARRGLPRRADPETPDTYGAMKLAPPISPASLDALCGDIGENLANPRFAGFVRVRRQLDPAAPFDLLESARDELEQARAGDLRVRVRHTCRDAAEVVAQRRALFRRRKNPSSSSSGGA